MSKRARTDAVMPSALSAMSKNIWRYTAVSSVTWISTDTRSDEKRSCRFCAARSAASASRTPADPLSPFSTRIARLRWSRAFSMRWVIIACAR
ncbi:MAG: hypothetical protein RR758_07975 [Burkholderiaceae bacterium]